MKDTLIIRLQQPNIDHATPVQWLLFDEQQQKIDTAGITTKTPLAELAAVIEPLSDNYRVCVIVATEEVLLTQTAIPSKQLKQIKQALPFMVEELIAKDIETVHLAMPTPLDQSNGIIDVAVVQHSVLIRWLDLLHSNHLSPTSITVDTLCLPYEKNTWSIIGDSNRMLIRTGDNTGLACEITDIEMIIASLIQQTLENKSATTANITNVNIKPTINLITTEADKINQDQMPNIVDYLHTHFPDIDIKQSHYQESSNELITSHYLHVFNHTLNLLQGGYRVGAAGFDNTWQQWRLAASVVGLGIIMYLTLSLASGFYFSQQTEKLDREAVALYKRIFPNERRVVSAKKQMQNHLRQLTGGNANNHFLVLLEQTAKPLAQSYANGKLAVQQLRFNADQNNLQLEIQSQSIEQLDQFKQLLAESGLTVDINSATEQGENVLGRLVVREK